MPTDFFQALDGQRELHTGTSTSQSTPILLNKPLSILLRVGCTHYVCRFTQVYDIVNETVYQVYSKFRIQNSEFRIQKSELRIQNSEFRIRNSELWIVTEMKKVWGWIHIIVELEIYIKKENIVSRSKNIVIIHYKERRGKEMIS